jgi:hypothetical protein
MLQDVQCKENTLQEQDEAVHQNSILDILSLAEEHLIFKWDIIQHIII